jgi:hypothetical protein
MDLSLATLELRPRCSEIQSLTSKSTEVRDEGYSPSPHTGIVKDEGYSPSPVSVSLFPVIITCLFTFNPSSDLRALLSSLHFFTSRSLYPPCFPSCLPQQGCVWIEYPHPWSGLKAIPMGSLPHPSLTVEEALPTYHPDGNSFMVRGLF